MTTKTKRQKSVGEQIEESAHKSGSIRAESLSRAQAELQKFSTTLFDRVGFDKLAHGKMQIVINTESDEL